MTKYKQLESEIWIVCVQCTEIAFLVFSRHQCLLFFCLSFNLRSQEMSVCLLCAGFNPTFGPSWVNLYGSPQNSTLGDVHQVIQPAL